ncbi:TlyA family RNA methyltransferase [Phenylobacterium montanum]|uniref:TlyA family RNA methyltransferase n=1 Tax=Phenylobacterium montanum TaxID=2823693 RepID=A0A975IV41_9CAUL|nr:TlyA family RNA methyltransferase [Caulobacter sp. S6]QUD88607.1 TlyA family RNA methyltransferase [Caulobacter sp. S6]
MERRRADLLLVERGLFESRAKARAAIEAGRVAVDGRVLAKPAELVDAGAEIVAKPAHPWVGRGGLKLDHALTIWPITVAGRTVLDVGASTGGFTEVCLTRDAAKVFAVDVGHGQLHPKLLADPRVVNLEGVDARALTTAEITEPPTLVVCDASFISLAKVLGAGLRLVAESADLVALVKPQFEVGPDKIGKGGNVRDPEARAGAVQAVADWLVGEGWMVRAREESPIRGGDGAVEHLIWATKA